MSQYYNDSFLIPKVDLAVMKLDDRALLPTKANEGDLGYDLYALEDTIVLPNIALDEDFQFEVASDGDGIVVDDGVRVNFPTKVRTGIACRFPTGYGALIRDRSGVSTKQGIFVVAGVIDAGYRGEIIVVFQNPYVNPVEIKAGQKIAQMILTKAVYFPVSQVLSFGAEITQRGDKGFGSSGQ